MFNPVCIDEVYAKIVNALKLCSADAVPMRSKHFFKFWWSKELDCLKDNAIESDKLWKAAGRPRSGPLYSRRSTDKRAYRAAIRKNKRDSDTLFTNEKEKQQVWIGSLRSILVIVILSCRVF